MRLRRERRLSLWALARVAGTSVATISRYESGWSRFELSTLRKLATALGCRIEITWRPVYQGTQAESEADVIRRLGRLFWDRPLAPGDMERYRGWVVGRVVQYGKVDDVRALAAYLGRAAFLETVAALRMPSAKIDRFWQAMLRLEGMPCTKKLSPRRAASSWPG